MNTPGFMLSFFDPTLPASLAHLRMEVTSLPFVVLHWDRTAAAFTPTVPSLALTPQRYAVAVPALSGTCALVLYVCRDRGHGQIVYTVRTSDMFV